MTQVVWSLTKCIISWLYRKKSMVHQGLKSLGCTLPRTLYLFPSIDQWATVAAATGAALVPANKGMNRSFILGIDPALEYSFFFLFFIEAVVASDCCWADKQLGCCSGPPPQLHLSHCALLDSLQYLTTARLVLNNWSPFFFWQLESLIPSALFLFLFFFSFLQIQMFFL